MLSGLGGYIELVHGGDGNYKCKVPPGTDTNLQGWQFIGGFTEGIMGISSMTLTNTADRSMMGIYGTFLK